VISIGNLHWGGGGKTPLVAAVAAALRDGGHGGSRRIVILSRGYRRQGGPHPEVLSRGDGPLLPVERAGDEPHQLARELPGVAVVVGGDRFAAGQLALRALDSIDAFLLDDGFSHVALHRDLELLVFPAATPFGGGRLLPGGRLREPLTAARWADAAVLTGLETTAAAQAPERARALDGALRAFGFRGHTFYSTLGATLRGCDPIQDRRLLLVSGVARPRAVAATARRLAAEAGLEIAGHLAFPDHHHYSERNLREIERRAADLGCRVLTTSKDLAKLEGRLVRPPATIDLRALPEETLLTWLEEALTRWTPDQDADDQSFDPQPSGAETSKSGSPPSTG
jgi:tetraacyldisaccharide 4'-kinase